ncbi:MAG: DoxX family membrane protein [candidate division KSB1 bacterium]|nr:DoxX family membrane protein [candidate division KSB1 bacterium]MDZ7294959.1 DoxX family membrane protein [candidate division KSB1 bacterium]MDZ7338078.1 DoxX family membrane protein [candidate division KSB1 bacterium]MDZ7384734.1 DoxX family membrane protein [candidate division KSB1 bacterium]MDZ7392304.1 DoxX family membrane protein [candidate division KSB1 bacterium]
MKRELWYHLVRIALGAVFVYAAVGKIADPAGFLRDVDNYRLLPFFAAGLTAIILPWLELLCGLGLILRRWVQGSAMLIAAMLVLFIAGLVSALVRGLDISCGCFAIGSEASRVSVMRVLEDSVMLAAALWVWWKEGSS